MARAKEFLKDPEATERARLDAIHTALGYNLRDLKPDLERLAKDDPSRKVRRMATRVLESWQSQDARAAKREARAKELQRRSRMTPQERREAEKAAEKQHFTERRDEILHDLRHGTLEQRRILASIGTTWVEYIPEALPIFHDILKNEQDVGLRYKAVMVLSMYEGNKAAPLIRTCLGPENPDSLRRLAACELARLGHKDGVSVLIELLRTKDIRLRKSVVRSLRALTRTNFGYPMRTRARRRSAPTHEVAPEEAIAAWEAWWKKREATFVFPHPPISTRPVDRPPTTRRRRQDGTAAKPSIFVDTAERQKVLEGARAVFGNKNARPREKVLKLSEAYRYDLRELKADVQRLANEDPYESVRRAASFLLDKWERQPASAPGAAMGSSATVPGALHEGQRTKVPAGGKGPTMRDIALLTAKRALNDPNAPFPRRVSKLAEVLGHDLRELKPDLERLAREDASPRIRRDATSILERWKQQDAAAARAKARMDQLRRRAEMTPEERRAADKSAERRYFTGHRDQYLRELKEGALEQRRLAVRTAFTWAEYVPEALPILRDIIKNEDDLALRYGAVMALGKHGGQEAVPLLRTCLASRNPEKLRWVAASELARLGDKEGVGVLVQLLRTDDVKAQTNTIMILRTVTRAEFGYPTEIELAQSISPEQEVARRKAIAAWEAWWKDNGATFVMPYPPGTTITSQPTTRPARKESRVGTGAQGSSP